jgi:hypothetical protein
MSIRCAVTWTLYLSSFLFAELTLLFYARTLHPSPHDPN